jgi:hypothetical protein
MTVQQATHRSQQPTPCGHWIGDAGRYCHATHGVRLYQTGPRCPDHAPARLAGRPEPPDKPTPSWWMRDGQRILPPPLSASRLVDDRAIASGKRRASIARVAEAKAAEADRRAREAELRRGSPDADRPEVAR